ncbi:class I SAM-dependent methyltransferase [Clostridium senegalense]|uniref:Class I SAM-dependent methyltransferase n=1 Tax=Clostridium senegalense TaxID=1465809 RepID=A0A6M0H3H2_9CLOT|nr:class I SAM-dependent methyltransferase [Clostridium senegalense]NEU04788.1 class I SAM-dependent methyltransferase [Clostridium senegalense]
MYKEVEDILVCPRCGSKINIRKIYLKEGEEIIEGTLNCEKNHKFYIKHGIIDFHYKENKNVSNLAQFYFERDFENINIAIENKTPNNLRNFQNLSKQYMNAIIQKKKYKNVLDIASGRSILLEGMAEKFSHNPNIVSLDLNFAVLKYNRKMIKKINPKAKITYIACDYLNLPFKNSAFDCITSYYGFPNMTQSSPRVMQESYRILRRKGLVLDARILVSDKDEYYNQLKAIATANMNFPNPEIVSVEQLILQIYKKIGFSEFKNEKIGESIGEFNELDIIPMQGQKFKSSVLIIKK